MDRLDIGVIRTLTAATSEEQAGLWQLPEHSGRRQGFPRIERSNLAMNRLAGRTDRYAARQYPGHARRCA